MVFSNTPQGHFQTTFRVPKYNVASSILIICQAPLWIVVPFIWGEPDATEKVILIAMSGFFLIGGLCMFLLARNHRMVIFQNSVEVTSSLGRQKRFAISDIASIQYEPYFYTFRIKTNSGLVVRISRYVDSSKHIVLAWKGDLNFKDAKKKQDNNM